MDITKTPRMHIYLDVLIMGMQFHIHLAVIGGWAAEINLKETLHALFDEPFGIRYSKESAERKLQTPTSYTL